MPPDEGIEATRKDKELETEEESYNDDEALQYYKLTTDPNYKYHYNPVAIGSLLLMHVGAFYGLYLILTFKLKLMTLIWTVSLGLLSLIGALLGAHRGFSHNAFKVTTFGKVMLIIFHSISGQSSIYWWAKDHRLHYKFVDTDADPYNSKRGFFFAHFGWILVHKHPLLTEKRKTIDVSDLESDKLIMFQNKYMLYIFLLFTVAIPAAVPTYFWNENFWISFFTAFNYRYVHVLNATWTINSFAHLYGEQPFDARLSARMSKVCHRATLGEGWHNYHHAFPMHYGISEFGYKGGLLTNTLLLMEKLGLAYDLKSPSSAIVYNHSIRHGNGSIGVVEFKQKSN